VEHSGGYNTATVVLWTIVLCTENCCIVDSSCTVDSCSVYSCTEIWTVELTCCCRWDSQEEDVAEARQGVGQFDEYLDSQTDSSYAETVNTVQSVDVVDRQFTTVG